MKSTKHLIILFFVTLFLSTKVAGLHVLTHDADDAGARHCELCDITTALNFVPLLPTSFDEPSQTEILYSEPKLKSDPPQFVVYNKAFVSRRFTRPPPQVS